MPTDIAGLRNDYKQKRLNREDLQSNPFHQFEIWLDEAINSEVREPTAMTLATVSEANLPSARIVLLKKVDEKGFVFFTNYQSRKGAELNSNPNVALVFYWAELERQVRVEGSVEKVDEEISKRYFDSRPEPSKISAIISPQSKEIPDRQFLEQSVTDFLREARKIEKPSFWGGFRVIPKKIEFWQGRENRLHDRFLYVFTENIWKISRLAP